MGRPSASKLSALTALKVPTPPVRAQLPADIPFEIATPLPPSTRGRTSNPPILIALIARMASYPPKGQSSGQPDPRKSAATSRPADDPLGQEPSIGCSLTDATSCT